jgi:hypothetical protein
MPEATIKDEFNTLVTHLNKGHMDRRTHKGLLDQLNEFGIEGQVVAIRSLPSNDLVLTTDDTRTRTEWLRDIGWLEVLGEGVHIKRREFIIIAHGIRVSQVQV